MSYHLRIKICGITNEADARYAAWLGADAIGLNFSAESPRRIDFGTAKFVLREMPPFVDAVGVWVNRPLKKIYEEVHQLGRVRTIQWHGQHRELSDAFPFQLIQAFPVRDSQSLVEVRRYLEVASSLGQLPAAVLLDGYAPGKHGGTGQSFPWELLAEFRPEVPILIAGGLTPENVEDAVRIVRPYGVDVASGVEHTVGHKDPEKVRRFIDSARNAAVKLSDERRT